MAALLRWVFRVVALALALFGGTGIGALEETTGNNHSTLPVLALPFGDVNVIVVTDVHSWVGGHKDHEELYSANYGDVLSFVEHLKLYGQNANKDVWFVMNGDWIHGTGLAMNGDPSQLIPILERMPYDAINVGNHELYQKAVIEYMTKTSGFVEWFGRRYLSSNVLFTETMQPIGHHYMILKGRNANVLTMGFLFNMFGNADTVTVQQVQQTVAEKWFVNAVKATETYDAILVLAHMDVRDPLCQVILDKIRDLVGEDMPVQFITGHTHRRDFQVFDEYSVSFEAGRYLDTIGFVSFPTFKSVGRNRRVETSEFAESTNMTTGTVVASPLFKHEYLNANIPELAAALGLSPESFPTENGIAQSEFIFRVQNEMGLKKVIGCAKQNFYLNRSLSNRDSLWRFFQEVVVPSRLDADHVFFIGNGAWRYDLFAGDVKVDDALAVSPFNNSLTVWKNVPYDVIVALNLTMNAKVTLEPSPIPVPQYILAPASSFVSNGNYTLVVDSFEADEIGKYLANLTNVAAAEVWTNVTTSSIWLDYFLENSHDCKHAKVDGMSKPPTGSFSGFTSANPEADTIRLMFVVVACIVIAALGTLAVWQKGVIFHQVMEARDMATMQAIREYEDEGEYADADADESEGEFV